MKELLLIGTTVFALTTGGVTAVTSTDTPERPERGNHVSVAMINKAELMAEAQADMLRKMELGSNTAKVKQAIDKLKTHVGRTWYVFSGNTPAGWDCSGLTMWFYEQIGIELEHRASKQDTSGKATTTPKPGDIVVFKYRGSNDAYHVGIYIGNGEMIHAPKHGHLTRIEDIKTFGGNYSNITYRTLIETI